MSLPGEYTHHESTIRPNTRITAEVGCHGPCFVRVRTAGAVTYEERWGTELRARERFERVVENHELGRLPWE